MIEIAIQDTAKYDMVQVLQKAEQGEKVVLNLNGKQFNVIPNQSEFNEITHRQNVHLSDLFEQLNRLPAKPSCY